MLLLSWLRKSQFTKAVAFERPKVLLSATIYGYIYIYHFNCVCYLDITVTVMYMYIHDIHVCIISHGFCGICATMCVRTIINLCRGEFWIIIGVLNFRQ